MSTGGTVKEMCVKLYVDPAMRENGNREKIS